MYVVVEKLKEKNEDYDYDMRFRGFEQVDDAIIWAITAPLRCDFPLHNYNDVYECNVYELGKENKIL